MEDRSTADMARVKAREAEVRQALACGEPVVDAGPFNMVQLGLAPVYVDGSGRFWRHQGRILTLVRGSRIAIEPE